MTGLLVDLDRLDRARGLTAAAGLDAMLVTPGEDLRYLCGYEALPLERLTCLVIRPGHDPVLVAPELEVPAARVSPVGQAGIEIRGWGETEDPFALVASLVPGAVRLALDDHMWAQRVMAFRDAVPGATQVLAGPVIRDLRMHKTEAEVEALAAAGRAIDSVHEQMGQWLKPGRTEREVGADIADAILAAGHITVDFVIVASGPNGASPHHEVSDRTIEPGDPVVVDIGGTTAQGYCSDCTRTYAVGDPSPDFLAMYEVLLAAQQAACTWARPGVTAESVDAAARDVIDAGGYGELFIHRTGHGIGLSTHEEPYIVAGNTIELAPGMAFSIEPGIYRSGVHGARIEDIVVCTDDSVRRLNVGPRELAVLDT